MEPQSDWDTLFLHVQAGYLTCALDGRDRPTLFPAQAHEPNQYTEGLQTQQWRSIEVRRRADRSGLGLPPRRYAGAANRAGKESTLRVGTTPLSVLTEEGQRPRIPGEAFVPALSTGLRLPRGKLELEICRTNPRRCARCYLALSSTSACHKGVSSICPMLFSSGVMNLAEVRLQEGESIENALRRFKKTMGCDALR